MLYEREGILNTSAPMDPRRVLWSAIETQDRVLIAFASFIKIKGLTDIYFRAQGSATGTKVAILMNFYLVDANAEGE